MMGRVRLAFPILARIRLSNVILLAWCGYGTMTLSCNKSVDEERAAERPAQEQIAEMKKTTDSDQVEHVRTDREGHPVWPK